MQALGELAVCYPQNGAFTAYIIRFIDVSYRDSIEATATRLILDL